MSLVNLAAHYGGLFWDGRAPTLENAVLQPIQNPVEMGMTLDELEARLAAQPDYAPLFAAAFGDTDVGSKRIASALAAFVRAIVSVRSRYDDGLAAAGRMGVDVDFANFTAAENHGKRLFFGEPTTRSRSCAACHVERIESCCGACWSVVPAAFDSRTCTNNGVDAGHPWDDPGRGGVTQWAKDRGAFRAPSLRNVELTAPYMHDGRFATLDDVLRFYSGRVRAHPNLHRALAQACWSPRPQFAAIAGPTLGFQFNSRDRDDLVAFLKTLTDRSLVADPRFADPFAPSAR
jgi:cytochrome c peroxidase